MKKIVYIMHVEWAWIKQRPHFIAEELGRDYEVTVVYRHAFRRAGLQEREDSPVRTVPVKLFPFESRIPILKKINKALFDEQIKRVIRQIQPDWVYITYPTLIDAVPVEYGDRVLYDCMDFYSAICDREDKKEAARVTAEKEREAVGKATVVFTSSEYLRTHLIHEYTIESDRVHLIRNAYGGGLLSSEELWREKKPGEVFRLAYIGMISGWFDWELVLGSLETNGKLEVHLFGPVGDETRVPKHSRLIQHGVIEHRELYDAVGEMDAFVMPFTVNEVIEAVDPVKLYEYINFGKNILVPRYAEIERFEPFVYFYENSNGFNSIVKKLMEWNAIKYSDDSRIAFLAENTWRKRTDEIQRIIEGIHE